MKYKILMILPALALSLCLPRQALAQTAPFKETEDGNLEKTLELNPLGKKNHHFYLIAELHTFERTKFTGEPGFSEVYESEGFAIAYEYSPWDYLFLGSKLARAYTDMEITSLSANGGLYLHLGDVMRIRLGGQLSHVSASHSFLDYNYDYSGLMTGFLIELEFYYSNGKSANYSFGLGFEEMKGQDVAKTSGYLFLCWNFDFSGNEDSKKKDEVFSI